MAVYTEVGDAELIEVAASRGSNLHVVSSFAAAERLRWQLVTQLLRIVAARTRAARDTAAATP